MDQNFDTYYDRFQRNIYETPKGKIRLDVLTRDIKKILDEHGGKKLRILDVGSGRGHLSLELAKQGHHLTLCDISDKMLKGARDEFAKQSLSGSVSFVNTSLNQLPEKLAETYDLVLCHAVLEWLHDSEQSISFLKKLIAPGGCLSLMFYNKNAVILKSILKGNFFKEGDDFKFGKRNNLTPTNPLKPDDVYNWIARNDLTITDKTGVRIFFDHIEEHLKKDEYYQRALENELQFCKEEAFIAIARYVHVVCVTGR